MRPTHPTAPHPGLAAWRRTRKLAYRILAVVSADPTKLLQNLPLLLPRRPSVTPKNLPEVLPFRSPTHPVTLPPPSSARVTFSNGATIPPPVTFCTARCADLTIPGAGAHDFESRFLEKSVPRGAGGHGLAALTQND